MVVIPYDVDARINRAGATIIFNDQDGSFVVKSNYIPRYTGSGTTKLAAFQNYIQAIQEPTNWKQVVMDLFAGHQLFLKAVKNAENAEADEQADGFVSENGANNSNWTNGSELSLSNPMHFWHEVLLPIFDQAYIDGNSEHDTISRMYAFADWSTLQAQDEDVPGKNLPTCATVCFYEHILRCPPALKDMPNWFKAFEIEWLFYDLANRRYYKLFCEAFGIEPSDDKFT